MSYTAKAKETPKQVEKRLGLEDCSDSEVMAQVKAHFQDLMRIATSPGRVLPGGSGYVYTYDDPWIELEKILGE